MLSCWAFAPVFKLTYGRKRRKKKDDDKQAALSSFALYYQCYCLKSQWVIQKKEEKMCQSGRLTTARRRHAADTFGTADRRRESMKEWAEPRPTASAETSFFFFLRFFFFSLFTSVSQHASRYFLPPRSNCLSRRRSTRREAPYNILRDSYLPNIHILSKYLTVVLYYVLLAYFPKMC